MLWWWPCSSLFDLVLVANFLFILTFTIRYNNICIVIYFCLSIDENGKLFGFNLLNTFTFTSIYLSRFVSFLSSLSFRFSFNFIERFGWLENCFNLHTNYLFAQILSNLLTFKWRKNTFHLYFLTILFPNNIFGNIWNWFQFLKYLRFYFICKNFFKIHNLAFYLN